MKVKLFLLALAFLPNWLWAQSDSLQLQEYQQPIAPSSMQAKGIAVRSGLQNTFSMRIPTDDPRLLRRVWRNYVQTQLGGRTKYDRKSKALTTTNASISGLSQQPVTLVGKPQPQGDLIDFTLSIEISQSLGSRQWNREAQQLLNAFVVEIEREKVRLHLKSEQKALSALERDLRRLQNANQRYHHEIEMALERIQRLEESILQNTAKQEKAIEDINRQQQVVKSVQEELGRIN